MNARGRTIRQRFTAVAISGALAATAFVMAAGTAQAAHSTMLYAAPTGKGKACRLVAPCSITQAQETVRRKAADMTGDITVYLRGGTYQLAAPLSFGAADSGQNGHTVSYLAYPGEAPAISGGRSVTGWTLSNAAKNIWAAPVPAGTQSRQLYVNGVRVPRASGASPVSLTQTADGYTAGSTALAGWRNPSNIEFVFTGGNGAWTQPRCDVASVSGTTITMRQPCWSNLHLPATPTAPDGDNPSGGFGGLSGSATPSQVENAYELLSPGHWYLDQSAHMIYYIPKAGQTVTSLNFVLPTLTRLVEGAGTLNAPVHNLAFSGITFEYATWLQPSGDDGFAEMQANMTLTGAGAATGQGLCSYISPAGTCPFAAWTKPPAAVDFSAAHNVSFTGDLFTHLGAAGLGLQFGSQNNSVKGDEFTDISGSAVLLGNTTDPQPIGGDTREISTGNTITDDYVHNVGVEYWGAPGIWVGYTQHTQITHNQLNDLPYSGISLGWGGWHTNSQTPDANANINSDNLIADNLIFHHMQSLQDGGAIYTNGPQGTSLAHGLTISGNVAYDDHTNNEYYTDEGGAYVTISGNVAYHNDGNFNGGCSATGHMSVTGNYYVSGLDGFVCSPATLDIQPTGNIQIPGNPRTSDIPASILSQAGLEPAYAVLSTRETPRVLEVGPNVAPGGTSVLISGSGFAAGAQVHFGTVPSPQVTVLSPGLLTAVAPSAGTGTVDVTVTTAVGTSPVDTGKDPFTYGTNLSLLATASASNTFQNSPDWAPSKAIDGNEETRWATDSGVTAATLDLTWPGPVSVSRTMLEEWTVDGQRIRQYQIQYWDGSAWATLVNGGTPTAKQVDQFTPVTTTRIRLNITQSTDGPTIKEFQVS
jgi:hypothetical protein